MLKKYLQALLEAFLGSKKEWITKQVSPNHSSIEIPLSINSSASFVAPSDGWIHVESRGYDPTNKGCWVNIVTNASNGAWRSSASMFTDGEACAQQSFARKGDSHTIWASGAEVVVCHFIPSVGSV